MQSSLAQQVQDLANNLRNQQKRMINLMRSVNTEDGGSNVRTPLIIF